jgi:hypothetical protein
MDYKKDETRVRWDGGVLCSASHRGPWGGSAPVNSEREKIGNAAYPKLGCSNGVVDEVREVVAELWA